MMNNKQLSASIDSLFLKLYNKSEEAYKNIVKKIHPDKKKKKTSVSKLKDLNILEEKRVFTTAINTAMSNKALVENANRDINYNETLVAKHLVEWHRKWSLAIACIIMFLIGAPLGAIIRKGGFGMPVVTSVFFFILLYIDSKFIL